MTNTYAVLLRLRHPYFAEEVGRTLAVVPTLASAQRLRRAGWLLQAQADGLVLLVPGVVPATWQAGTSKLFPLLFHLQPREASFHASTDLPLAPATGRAGTQLAGGQLAYYFSLPPTAVLPPSTELVASAANQLVLRLLQFGYELPDGQTTALWPVPNDYRGAPLCSYNAGARRAQIDMREFGSGHYELRSATTSFEFYADDDLAAAGAWGMLALTDQVLAAPSGTCYTLRFAARPAD